ncbi:MAG TPA: helix-turn-helix domain-containing protein [Paludibacter sp.]|nr:helix-turn-helix domain-containing protein [Paludibacter sp.]
MNLDYRFPLFDSLLQGKMNPLLPENNADAGFRLRLQEQIVESAVDEGCYTLTFVKWAHPKTDFYRRLLLGETFAYCNELTAHLRAETNRQIRAYYREMILDRHLVTCLQRLGEAITESGLKLSSLSQPAPEDTTDSLANCYVLHLLKVCLAKAYLEVQQALGDVVLIPQTELMLYSAYLHELPPVRTFLEKRAKSGMYQAVQEHPHGSPETERAVNDLSTGGGGMPEEVYMLVSEAAKALMVSEKTILRRLSRGEIKGVKDKNRWLIDKTAFKTYLNGISAGGNSINE